MYKMPRRSELVMCPVCYRDFAGIDQLKSHMHIVHKTRGAGPASTNQSRNLEQAPHVGSRTPSKTPRSLSSETEEDDEDDEDEDEDDDEDDQSESNHHDHKSAKKSTPQISVPVPTLASVAAAHPTRSSLYSYLFTLPRPVLVSMLVNLAPRAPATKRGTESASTTTTETLAHCVYCHEPFSLEDPEAGNGCRIKHYSDYEDDGERVEYYCCGAFIEYADYDPRCHAPPEKELGKYCWEGQHRAIPLQDVDFENVYDEEEEEDLGLDETYFLEGLGKVELKNALWWKNWEEHGGVTCEEAGCRK